MFDLSTFDLRQMIESGRELRRLGQTAHSMQQAAEDVVDLLYSCFRDPATGRSSCALVRCFKTHPLDDLPPSLARVATAGLAAPDSPEPGQSAPDLPEPDPAMLCLTLLASRGDVPAWNSPGDSLGHQAIPLPTAAIVEKAPMIANLILQMGLEIESVIHPDPRILIDLQQQPFNVFHVEEALGSELVPAQESFVVPFGIRSVIGFGGSLPSGEFFAIVMFSKVSVSRESAALFRTLALSVKLALLPLSGRQVFEHPND